MDVDVQVSLHDVEHSDALESLIRDRAEKLDTISTHLISCRAVIEAPHRDSDQNVVEYRARLEVAVPHKNLIAESKPSDDPQARTDPYEVVNRAFDRAERQLKDFEEGLRAGRKKRDQPLEQGVVSKLFRTPEYNYGFIESLDGREIYFHENAVVDVDFEDLEKGQNVRFFESTGDSSPDPIASTVRPTTRGQIQ